MSLIENAKQLIHSTLAASPGKPCVTSSFQADCVALVDLISAERPGIPVLFLDTGYHFDETYAYRDDIAKRLNLNLINLQARQTVVAQESQFGILYQSEPDKCCGFRKVEPLFSGLANYDTWFTALRRDQSPTRANLEEWASFNLPNGAMIQKVSPLAAWTMKDVWAYLKSRGIPVNPLYDKGYTSIGCAPCTALPTLEGNDRSGRWGGTKLECGIHIQAAT